MKTFTADDLRGGREPFGSWRWVWALARALAAEHPTGRALTFVVAEYADDLADGGPVAQQVCQGESLVSAIAACQGDVRRFTLPGGIAAWSVPLQHAGGLDLLIIPEARWTPTAIMAALCLGG